MSYSNLMVGSVLEVLQNLPSLRAQSKGSPVRVQNEREPVEQMRVGDGGRGGERRHCHMGCYELQQRLRGRSTLQRK